MDVTQCLIALYDSDKGFLLYMFLSPLLTNAISRKHSPDNQIHVLQYEYHEYQDYENKAGLISLSKSN